jgi:UDP-N-acetylmuramyl tripeptide synthase
VGGRHTTERGDFTGPGGTRRVISDQRVQAAVLEVARGGLLRRGLAVSVADAAIITNISADHFGEYGVESLADLARVKAIVARALLPGASLTLNADDASLVSMAASPACAEIASQISWFSVQPGHRARGHSQQTGVHVITDDNRTVLFASGSTHDLGDVREMPITLRGTATHNIANVAARARGEQSGRPHHAIRATLQSFGSARSDNPGRLMLRELAGVTIVMDYAHNPDGIASLCRTAAALPARRRLLLLGQAGNRDDEQLRALGAAAWATQAFDRVIIKEMPAMLRGREAGDIPARLREGLTAAGAPSSRIDDADGELTGVQMALAWAQPGDLLVLGVHVERERVLDLMERLAEMQWHPGAPLRNTPDRPRRPARLTACLVGYFTVKSLTIPFSVCIRPSRAGIRHAGI